ncbi:glucose-6-phosphate isomerase [candidate division WOR-1 bacterium RIFOXYB2_FULL_42_35]|uniref:Glucose-6-phosphate isomerase n=1 Tax=candidate division WOR-1 bacterium RIFOXYC2_FULL_41_25 TaxID=1802586 RepID=A0A1F4TRE1_UNCSA|nr:MAG: glucose-6-phosphate isomerase [candidate division WOR-1 bacterium RIFOXYA2_FULL_41_14]OGC24970.1 MAG: glucose-6-phosphate isomerase [candidate division WOR-1 bacterium RIFOXYB2_FULL_42_35]OGC35169.1 MAG: glucose-6-phosphate isomerase [candidate division WOR-1 bacterium RIFOXYC2_FULL_41_25]
MEASVALPKPINKTLAWRALQAAGLYRRVKPVNMREVHKDPKRVEDYSVRTEHAYYDYSRQQVDSKIMWGLKQLVKVADVRGKAERMFSGEKINHTEKRAVLHTALRQQSDEPVKVDGKNVIPEVKKVLAQVKLFSERVLSGEWKGVTGKKIKNIVAIGIGGSYLGPEYLAEACKKYAKEGMTLRFVANVDGSDFAQKTADLDAEETMFIVVSKTFTTAETIKNAEAAKAWMINKLEDDDHSSKDIVSKHFVAVSTAKEKVAKFGIDTNNMFGFWDWVGGRYSATSAVGAVPLSLFLGYDKFEEILKGAAWMDHHFRTAPFEKNIPMLAGTIDVWNSNFLGINIRALLAYLNPFSKLAPHTQQVEMESNGKQVDIHGRRVGYTTGEVVFGEPGTNGQHSFYQLIHQGVLKVACDFIGFIKPQYPLGTQSATEVSHHQELNTNLAQLDALAFGKTLEEVKAGLRAEGKLTEEKIDALAPHMVFDGNRPSSLLLVKEATPFTAGLLLAFTEHRAAVKGFIWNINSFDQWGVQLGKKLAVAVRKLFIRANAAVEESSQPELVTTRDDLARASVVSNNALIKGELPTDEDVRNAA